MFNNEYKQKYDSLFESYVSLETAHDKQELKWQKKFEDYKYNIDKELRDLRDSASRNSGLEDAKHLRTVENLKHNHVIALANLQNKLDNFESAEITKLKKELAAAHQENAVSKQKVEMLEKIVDMSGELVDVKELIQSLLNKLPTVEFKNLVATTEKASTPAATKDKEAK